MRRLFLPVFFLGLLCSSKILAADETIRLRPPAVPLVACDPFFSIWSCADRLTDDTPRHWTRRPHTLTSMVRVDGQTYRLMGKEPGTVPAMPQVSVQVLPTRSIYVFQNQELRITLTFLTPSLPQDLDILGRPVTYITWEVSALDGKSHQVAVYFDASSEITVNTPDQQVVWNREKIDNLHVLRIGSRDQPVLGKSGDDLRIDWGYLYGATSATQPAQLALAAGNKSRETFAAANNLPLQDDTNMPRAVSDQTPVMAFRLDFGAVNGQAISRFLVLAYDELYSIQYIRSNLRPYWRRHGADAQSLLATSVREYEYLVKQCVAFDAELLADLEKAGGKRFALLNALAYRQCFAGNNLAADAKGQPLLFPKENTSNGCIATVDVLAPMSPQFLLFGPTLSKAMLVPVLEYAASPRWKFPNAPHDLGTYPKANGQRYGGGEHSNGGMPVEESGNMLILLAALARMEGNADFAGLYWPTITRWAEYLKEKGFDPDNQLCTDDFMGPMPHNTNLSVKAIIGLGAYGELCRMRGDRDRASEYGKLAREFAARWLKEADDGDHFRLAFDRPKSWSQQYNLVWDRLLGLNLIPDAALRKQMDYYLKHQNRYGLPLDIRTKNTTVNWTLWSACLTGERADFEALTAPVFDFANETPDRVPLSDYYSTTTAKDAGMHARPVIGGVFLRMLQDAAVWKKWADQDKTRAKDWAPIPTEPKTKVIVPTAEANPVQWQFTTKRPPEKWFVADFDAASWQQAPAPFGAGLPNVRTKWNTSDIWLRTTMTVPPGAPKDLQFRVFHDEDVEIYVNGVPAAATTGYVTEYELLPMSPQGRAALKTGVNTIAVHCLQTRGGQFIDVGIVRGYPERSLAQSPWFCGSSVHL